VTWCIFDVQCLSCAMSPQTSSAYLLVSHGSRDPRPKIATAQLAEFVAQQLIARGVVKPLVKTAVLDCTPIPLHQQIQAFAEQARASRDPQAHSSRYPQGVASQAPQAPITQIYLIPLFLVPGVHVMEDIPSEVAIAQTQLGKAVQLTICPYIGTDLSLYQLLNLPASGKIFMSHGSRRAGGNAPIEAIATQIEALPAYWSVEPKLETQVAALVAQGCLEITVLPYFLFEGGITDAIAQTVIQLSQQFPTTRLKMAETLGANSELATHIVNLIP
jgi:sirohydrochlorin cobaltochelatase